MKRKRFTKHHVLPKARKGNGDPWNLSELTHEHHTAFHKLFGLRTYKEAAIVLLRMDRKLKERR